MLKPKLWLHGEGAIIALASLILYSYMQGNWLHLILLFLIPDIPLLIYMINKKIGVHTYNLMHVYVWPAILFTIGLTQRNPLLIKLGLIWSFHIGIDRTLGYGLKYQKGFKYTHMQKL